MSTTRTKLHDMVQNIWWSWNPVALDLFEELNPAVFHASGNNPVIALREAKGIVLNDPDFSKRVDAAYDAFQAYMATPLNAEYPKMAYFCMEYGLHESLSLYSGGLGILAGDHCKAASDLRLPFTAIGLFLREGYFKQSFTNDGWQEHQYPVVNPADMPVSLVKDDAGAPVIVTVQVGDRPLNLQAWKMQIGHTVMYLLDSDMESNPEYLRALTHRLYSGGSDTRIMQEIVLGIGGIRLLRTLGVEVETYHMNEGHCSFLTLELLDEALKNGLSMKEAEAAVRSETVFTTHTPVEAGHDRFDPSLTLYMLRTVRESLGLSERDFLGLGRVDASDPYALFNMTILGFRFSRKQNGVSALNGELSRRMFKDMWQVEDAAKVPITHITNGIHLGTWAARPAQEFLSKHLGDWQNRAADPGLWAAIDQIPDELLWKYRSSLRKRLVEFIQQRAPQQTIPMEPNFDPDVLTIGFSRRFATYKRATLLFMNEERLLEIFRKTDRPIQVVYAGKAHPQDEGGKQLIQRVFWYTQHTELRGKVVLMENYNMEIGRYLVSGADIWLNNPRRPMEASGTSGQKVAIHGGLNLSILDGWWPEGYKGNNGWAIGTDASADIKDPKIQDPEDANFLYDTLENEVIPAFYNRDESGIPIEWVARMREAMKTLVYQFSAERQVRDYIEQIYKG